MKTLITLILLISLATGVRASHPNSSGTATGSINVSVTVVESSQIIASEPVATIINGEGRSVLQKDSPGTGRVAFQSHPQSEMLFSVSGNGSLTDGNGGSIAFSPEIQIGRNIENEQSMKSDGTAVSVIFTESDNGGYRGIAEIRFFGTLDAGDHTSGRFSSDYTVTAEHF